MTNKQFQQWSELLPGGALLLTGEGQIVAANAAAQAVWGVSAGTLVGRSLAGLFSQTSGDVERFCQACLAGEKVVTAHFTLAQSGLPVVCQGHHLDADQPGQPPQIVLSGVPQSASDPAGMDQRDSRDRLMGLLVHDFRNGLASVPMGLDVLEMERGSTETLELLRRQIETLVRLVDEALDVSRLVRGKLLIRREPLVLQELIQEFTEGTQEFLNKRELGLEVSLPAQPVRWKADGPRLLQALTTLLYERAKNMAAGGILTLSVLPSAAGLTFRLQDSGPVIAPELSELLFDLPAQLDSAGPASRTQVNLRLALVGGIIALHGGAVTATPQTSQPGMQIDLLLPGSPA